MGGNRGYEKDQLSMVQNVIFNIWKNCEAKETQTFLTGPVV